MTGMGSDGAKGMVEVISKRKMYIIAQDEPSCVVYGMPKAAIKANAVDIIASLDNIALEVLNAYKILKR